MTWSAYEGEPLLAIARRGLGAAALFASLPGDRAQDWAPAWSTRHLEALVRWLGRASPDRRPRLTWEDGVLALEDPPEAWPAEVRARAGAVEAWLVPDASPLTDPLERRAGDWPGQAPWGREVTLLGALQPEPVALATLVLPAGAPEELGQPQRRVARTAGGGGSRSEAPGGGEQAPRGHPAGPAVLGVGMLLVAAAGLVRGRR